MSYGLRLWNSSGLLVFDTSDRFTRYITSVSGSIISGPNGYAKEWEWNVRTLTATASVPGLSADGTWAVLPTKVLVSHNNSANDPYLPTYSRPVFTISGDAVTISWLCASVRAAPGSGWSDYVQTLSYEIAIYRY